MNERFRFLIVGLYAWIASLYFGGILLDMLYVNNLKGILQAPESAKVFSEISDTLLCIGFFMVITAIGAIAVSWKSGMARNLFIASGLFFPLEFLIPIVASFTKISQD